MTPRLISFPRTVLRNRRKSRSLDAEPPRFLTHTVTFTCNARCIMCDSWKKSGKDDLTIDEIARIYGELPRMDAVRLTGGEPFVRKDLGEITDVAERELRPLFLHITTNGFLSDRIVEYCEQRSKKTRLQVLVSVDGVGQKHDQVRGHSQAWARAIETLERLAPRRQELNLSLAVNQTIVDAEGAAHYPKLRDALEHLDVRNHVVMAYDRSATYSVESSVDVAPTEIGQFHTFGDFSETEIRALLDEVERDLEKLPWSDRVAKRYYVRGIRARLLGEGRLRNPRCVALRSHLRIFPNGDVPTCQFNSRVVGNLREESFEDLWKSATAREQRDWVDRCPGCWAECEVLPSAIYTGAVLS